MKNLFLFCALVWAHCVWSTPDTEMDLSGEPRLRMALAQSARVAKFKELLDKFYVLRYEGTNGYVVPVRHAHRARLVMLEKERLFIDFYRGGATLSLQEELRIGNILFETRHLRDDEAGSHDVLARQKEDIPLRDMFDEYLRYHPGIEHIARRMQLAHAVLKRFEAAFSGLSKEDLWFLKVHLYCLPLNSMEGINPLKRYAQNPDLSFPCMESLEGAKAYLQAQVEEGFAPHRAAKRLEQTWSTP
ncbi:MAG: hypothetical protein C0514_04685 [Candidatus Puniceispirillum sp.]|nr:hypothetical protein [Candidatus Puniceispirillum sp.]